MLRSCLQPRELGEVINPSLSFLTPGPRLLQSNSGLNRQQFATVSKTTMLQIKSSRFSVLHPFLQTNVFVKKQHKIRKD